MPPLAVDVHPLGRRRSRGRREVVPRTQRDLGDAFRREPDRAVELIADRAPFA
jgi:hypothetical protein